MSAEPKVAGSRMLGRVAPLALLVLGACSWFTDFKRQPKVDPWETVNDTIGARGQPQGSVPITGALVPVWQVSYSPLPPTIDSMSGLANPVAPDARSIANGRKYYAINCAVCHGDLGHGDGPATKYGMAGINITMPLTQGRTDGYIWGMIRNGRGIMPSYDRIEEMDRWDVVNYVRGLQGRLGRPVPTGPLAEPGVTGAALPGATRLGPTVPVPHWRGTPIQPMQGTAGEAAIPVRADSAAARGTTP